MKLSKVIIKNFRGYLDENIIDINDDLTTFIGKNDAGKSTILEALDIFFNDSKPDLEDLNIHASEKEIIIGGIFTDLPDEVLVDASAKTSLKEEYLLNKDGLFETVKKFSCTDKTISKAEPIIRASHPSGKNIDDLLTLKITELKDRGKDFGVEAADKRVSNLWRKAIWDNAKNLELKPTILKVEEFDTKARAIYTNLEALFPNYFLFKVDRQTSDADSEAKDPMQLAVKEAQKELQAEILALQSKIQENVNDVANRALAKLKEMDPDLAQQLNPTLKTLPKWTFDYKIEDDRGVSLNKRGSGTRRLVLLNFFRAEAEKKSSSKSGNIIYAIEEPETSQHPHNQKIVIEALLDLASDPKRQVLITTHSPQLADKLPKDSIQHIEFEPESKKVIVTVDIKGLEKAAESLGILSNQRLGSAKAVVIVEGESDELFLNHAAKELLATGHVSKTLADSDILVVPVGGCFNVPFWVQKYRLEKLGLPFAVFIDSDRKSANAGQTKNEKLCADLAAKGILAIHARKREIENYIDPSITGASYTEYDDAKSIIANHKNIKPGKVISTYWPSMTGTQIASFSEYTDGGVTKSEMVEVIDKLLTLV